MSEVIGKIIVIGNEEIVGSAGTFKKRLLVVETDEQYKQKIPIDFVQDKCSLLDNYAIGNDVKVGINIRGNEYNSKYYVSLNGWRIEKVSGKSESKPAKSFDAKTDFKEEEQDDLPF
jgi:hypothetical protein